jgi:predicted transcriptional regulator
MRVDAKLDRELKRLSRSLKQSKSDIARDALKRGDAPALSKNPSSGSLRERG